LPHANSIALTEHPIILGEQSRWLGFKGVGRGMLLQSRIKIDGGKLLLQHCFLLVFSLLKPGSLIRD
jgi:hypothetical protein